MYYVSLRDDPKGKERIGKGKLQNITQEKIKSERSLKVISISATRV